jgi:hypothetical protein
MREWLWTPSARWGVCFCLVLGTWVCTSATPSAAQTVFGRPGSYPVDGSPVALQGAAIDQQTGLDLVVANEAGESGPSLSFLINRGLGSFFPETVMSLDAQRFILQSVAAADFDGDGDGDVAAAVDEVGEIIPLRATVLVYLNSGNGNFAAPVAYPLSGVFPRAIVAAEATGNGTIDLVVPYSNNSIGSVQGLVSVLSGNGKGQFDVRPAIAVGSGPVTVAVGRLDADALPDLVVGDPAEGSLFVLYGTGASNPFAPPIELAEIGANAVAIANLDDTPLPEVLASTSSSAFLRIFSQTASRVFAPPQQVLVGFAPSAIAPGLFDDDALVDLVVVSALGAQLFVGNDEGTLTPGQVITSDSSLESLATAQLNGDARLDIALGSRLNDRVTVVLNGADAPFTPAPTATATPSPTRTLTGTRTATGTRTSTVTPTVRTATPSPSPLVSPTATIFVTATITRTPTITPTPLGPGDANCDGRIDAADVGGVVTNIFDPACAGADANRDQRVSAADISRVIELVAGD